MKEMFYQMILRPEDRRLVVKDEINWVDLN